MKNIIKLTVALTLIFTVFSQHTTAFAGTNFRFKDKGADAFFSSSNGCVTTDVFVLAGEEIYHSPPGPGNTSTFAVVYISQYDLCTGELLISASGFAWLPASSFQIVKKLNTASLDATVSLYDEVSGTYFDVALTLEWMATGPLIRQNNSQHFHSPGCNENIRNNGTFRLAQATGSISNGVNYIPEPSLSASTFLSKNGYVFAGCN